MKHNLLPFILLLVCCYTSAQIPRVVLPQPITNGNFNPSFDNPEYVPDKLPARNIISTLNKMEEMKNVSLKKRGGKKLRSTEDTVLVGLVPNDTLVITGVYTHTGPIYVFNDGVLIFHKATVTDTGDIYVFQNGKLFADSSSLTFPQRYFYEHSIMAVNNAFVHIQNSSFNYSGHSHSLGLADSATVTLRNIHQNDWTTCALFGNSSLTVDGCNLGGEYILSGSSKAVFHKTDTLILWHQLPETAIIDYSFPLGDTVYNYVFNNTVTGIKGLDYNLQVDSCHTVMWGIMPVNGSDVTISNSVIRAIGAWFQSGDTAIVRGLYDNSSYTNFITPLADRRLHLINTSVETWSLYVFDSSFIAIDSCRLGEVGAQQNASVLSQNFLLDGSGGYFWVTDTAFVFAFGVTVYTTVRSEQNGIFYLAYSWLPFSAPSAVGNSVLISVQNILIQDPVPYDNAVVWMAAILQPDSSYTDAIVPVDGKVWIDRGPAGGWMFFANYSLYYRKESDTTWNTIVLNSPDEIRDDVLGLWDTHGLSPDKYLLKLTVKNTFGDSVEAMKPVTLLPSVISSDEIFTKNFSVTVFPNPSDGKFLFQSNQDIVYVELYNLIGEKIYSCSNLGNKWTIDLSAKPKGVYLLKTISEHGIKIHKLVVN